MKSFNARYNKKHVISNIWGICRIDWIFTCKILKLLKNLNFLTLLKTLKTQYIRKHIIREYVRAFNA